MVTCKYNSIDFYDYCFHRTLQPFNSVATSLQGMFVVCVFLIFIATSQHISMATSLCSILALGQDIQLQWQPVIKALFLISVAMNLHSFCLHGNLSTTFCFHGNTFSQISVIMATYGNYGIHF